MAIVTVLVLLFGTGSLIYFDAGDPPRDDRRVIDAQAKQIQPTDPERARFLRDQSDQLRARMSARVPVKGVLTFIDSRGVATARGIDVGQELEFRSHIEGGTPAAAIWQFGARVPDPFEPKRTIDRRVPVTSLLKPGTIEGIENDAMVLEYGTRALEEFQKQPNVKAADVAKSATEATRIAGQVRELRDQSKKLIARYNELTAKAKAEKNPEEADRLRREAAVLHSPPIPIEMSFTIYRTTKGRVGDPVYAEIEVENPMTNVAKFRDTFPIREYYTNKRYIPSSYLVGSLGALNVTIHCMSPTQYLGMAESDFYLLADSGNFGWNFMKGLFGIWLQAMVLTAIGVFAGTFLSWPVALLFTIAFFVAGHAAFSILRDFFLTTTLIGGGPFESLIRLLSHDNQMSDLSPTLGVVVAKTFDSLVMPVMSTMVYLIPNLGTLDVSNTVSEGFAVGWPLMLQNTLIAAQRAPRYPSRSAATSSSRIGRWRRELPHQPATQDRLRRRHPRHLFRDVPLQAIPPGEGRGQGTRGGHHRPGRHRQLRPQAVPPRGCPGDGRERPLDPGDRAPEGPGVGPSEGDGRHDHQAPAPLPGDLDVPELEPDLQRVGRVGRPRGQVRVDQAGDQVRPETASARTRSLPT